MAIKISYIFLRTLSISLGIPLFACEGFSVNDNLPIPAYGQMYFVKTSKGIELVRFEKKPDMSMKLPEFLDDVDFTCNVQPLYVLPAI